MDSSQKGVVFGNSRKGYNKNDVNSYIEKMNLRFANRESELLSRIKELENAPRANADRTASESAPADNSIILENEALRKKIAELEARLSERQTVNTDEISSRLGNIIIKANIDAENLIKEAEALAAKQTADAERNADSIRFDAAVSARVLLESTKKQLALMTDEYISGFSSIASETAEECRKLCDELHGKIDACSKASEEIILKAKQ